MYVNHVLMSATHQSQLDDDAGDLCLTHALLYQTGPLISFIIYCLEFSVI